MPTQKQDLLEVIEFFAAMGNFIGKITEDGKITLSDFLENLQDLYNIPALALVAWEGKENITIGQVTDPADMEEVKNFFKERFDIPQDMAEEVVENGIDAMVSVFTFLAKLFNKPEA